MTLEEQLFEIERGFWDKGEPHFRAHMDDVCLISFADMAEVKRNEEIAAMAREAPTWSDIEIEPCGFVHPTPDFALINYQIAATGKDRRHRAIVSSGYVRRGDGWKAAFHGQALLPD
jgi:hypothetical protein